MLVYGAIVPHPPFVLERVGKEHAAKLTATRAAMESVGEDLLSLHIDTLVLITAHGERYKQALGIAFHDPYEADLKAFGDMGTVVEAQPDMLFIDRLQRVMRREGLRATMTTNDVLDHGAAIPLTVFEPYMQNMNVVVIAPPVAAPKDILRAGEVVREVADQLDKRVAVLCAADLSHRHSELSPGGPHAGAQAFDDRIRNGLVDGSSMALLNIPEEEIEELGGQDIDALRLFWGVLDDNAGTMQERAYEHPFGIGYLTMVAMFH